MTWRESENCTGETLVKKPELCGLWAGITVCNSDFPGNNRERV